MVGQHSARVLEPRGRICGEPVREVPRGRVLYGNIETATGGGPSDAANRTWRQISGDVVVRLLPNDMAYLAARYNTAAGEIAGAAADVNVQRVQVGGGLFITRNILAKLEYVNQTYNKYPVTNILNGGAFKGLMLEGAVAF